MHRSWNLTRALSTVVVGALLLVGAAACGGDDDGDALSQEEFVRQGNAICAEGNETLDAAIEEAFGDLQEGEEPSADEIAEVFQESGIPSIQKQIDDLGDLEPPENMSDDVDQLLDDAQAALDDLEEQIEDDPNAFLNSDEDPFADVNQQAGELGLTECDTSEEE
jgi:hypothetical protein